MIGKVQVFRVGGYEPDWTYAGARLINGEAVQFIMEIDGKRIGAMVGKALHNKRQRSKLGPVTIKIVTRKKHEQA